jgi:hypothetical protein
MTQINEITDKEREGIKQLLDELQGWFNLWMKGDISIDSFEKQAKYIHDDWKLVNKKTPAVINTKQNFLQSWAKTHGSFKDKKFKARREVVSIEKLSEHFFLVLSHSIRELDEGTHSFPITEIFIKDTTDNFQFYYAHE